MVKSLIKSPEEGNYKLVAFDLDGTLIRGRSFRYSWESVWKHLGFDDEIRVQFFNDYLNKRITYGEWCEKCFLHYKEKKLSRSDIAEICKKLKPTENLETAINILKLNGIKTAIISGGIREFLAQVIPNYNYLFDYVFINELHFDSDGIVSGVTPTPYDFEGKIEGLKFIAKKERMELTQCVFVGEENNDRFVFDFFDSNNIGLTIAYPPTNSEVEHRAHYKEHRNDLEKILKHIIGRNKR